MVSPPLRFQAFAGRASELEHLAARRAAAAKGRGGCVLVAGDPGIGKSRLIREFVASLPRRTTKLATAAYREFAQRPLGPLLDVLAQLGTPSVPAAGAASKAEFLAAIVDAFEAAAAAGTIVVVLEDLHWADREGLQVLYALCERASTRRLLFVGTYRDGEVIAGHPNFSLLGRLLRLDAVSHVALDPLGKRELGTLLRAAVAERAPMPAALIEGVLQRCDGNAFFAEELLRFAVGRFDAGERVSPSSMPLSLRAAVADRAGLASPAARALLEAASLFGRRFDPAIVRATFPATNGAAAATPELAEDEELEELARLGLVERTSEGARDYRFRHALLREIVYDAIEPREARRLHARIADAIERSDGRRAASEQLAHHYWHAGLRGRAAPYCLATADEARALFAYDDASHWYERASEGFDGDAEAGRALASGAQCAVYADRIERALELYATARQRFAQAGLADDVAIVSVLGAATMFESGRHAAAVALLEATRERWADAASAPVRRRLLLRLGFLYAALRRADAAWACIHALEDGADETPALAAERLFLRSNLHAQHAEVTDWRDAFERAYELFETSGAIADNRRVALSNAAFAATTLGELDDARAYQVRAIAIAHDIRSSADHERILLAQLDVQTGEVRAARAHFEQTAPADRFASRVERAILSAWLARLCGDDVASAPPDGRLLDEASAGGDASALARLACAFGALAEAQGREPQADALFARAAAALTTPFGNTFAVAAIALHRPKLATGIRAAVEAAAERDGARVERALLALIDASAARARGALAAAAARAAAEQFEAIGWRWLAAGARELAGDRRDALRFYRDCGAVAEVRRLERIALVRDVEIEPGGVLTPRERELARIVAAGAGNRAAALQLSISEKAVEKHLTSIYAKLGIASRAQLAAYVTERGTS